MTSKPSPPSPDIDAQSATDDAQKPADKPGLATLIFHHSITVLILVLFGVLGIWGYLNLQTTEFFGTIDRAELESQLQPSLETAQRQRLAVALEVYALTHDRYPTQLIELVNTGLLLPSDPYYPRGSDGWFYESHSEGFTLRAHSRDDAE